MEEGNAEVEGQEDVKELEGEQWQPIPERILGFVSVPTSWRPRYGPLVGWTE